MSAETISSLDGGFWAAEPARRPDRVRVRARIAGMHCSLCTGTIEKALGRQEGVDKVAVSLTHELLKTLREMGYTISDPRKLQPFDEQERQLVQEGRRLLAATVLSLGSLTLIARPGDFWYALLEIFVALCLLGFVFLVLRSSGLAKAVAGTSGALALVLALSWLEYTDRIAAWTRGWRRRLRSRWCSFSPLLVLPVLYRLFHRKDEMIV